MRDGCAHFGIFVVPTKVPTSTLRMANEERHKERRSKAIKEQQTRTITVRATEFLLMKTSLCSSCPPETHQERAGKGGGNRARIGRLAFIIMLAIAGKLGFVAHVPIQEKKITIELKIKAGILK